MFSCVIQMEDVMLRTLTTQFKHGSVLVRASRVWEHCGAADEGGLSHINVVLLDAEVRICPITLNKVLYVYALFHTNVCFVIRVSPCTLR